MTILEEIRAEMRKRGATKQQAEAQWIPMVLEILTENTRYKDAEQLEEDIKWLETNKRQMESMKRHNEERWAEEKNELMRIKEETEHYIQMFLDGLSDCETEEGADRLRAAQIFVNSVNIDTKYDNTAYIIGLSAILSGGAIAPVEELRKINPKINITPKPWRVK